MPVLYSESSLINMYIIRIKDIIMRKIQILLCILYMCDFAYCQTEFTYFNKVYTSDTTSIFTMPIVATEEGYYVAGLFGGVGNKGIFTQKLNLEGEVEWVKYFRN